MLNTEISCINAHTNPQDGNIMLLCKWVVAWMRKNCNHCRCEWTVGQQCGNTSTDANLRGSEQVILVVQHTASRGDYMIGVHYSAATYSSGGQR